MTPDCRFMLSALALEQWLRFAWLDEQERIAMPESARADTAACFPELIPLLDLLLTLENPADGDAARAAILTAAENRLGHETLVAVLDDPDFQAALRRFFGWVQDEAETPTCNPGRFADWWEAFLQAPTPEVR